MKKLRDNRVAAVAAGSALLVGLGSVGGAVAADMIGSKDIRNSSIRSVDIHKGGVHKDDIKSNSVGQSELIRDSIRQWHLADGIVDKLNDEAARGPQGPQGEQGPKGDTGPAGPAGPQGAKGDPASDVLGKLVAEASSDPVNRVVIEDIGGSILDPSDGQGHTPVTSITLQPGTYLVSAYGHFDRLNDTEPGYQTPTTDTYGVLALWVGETWSNFAQGRGTYITGAISPKGFVEATASGSQVVTVTETTKLNVSAFGYNEDRGGFGSGTEQFSVLGNVSAVKVG